MKRVAIVGFDHLHALSYLQILQDHPGVDLVGICDTGVNGTVASDMAARAGVGFSAEMDGYLDWDVEGVYLASTPATHLDHIMVAAPHGVHVLCEKPLATSLDDADAILRLTAEAGVGLSVPFRPVFQTPTRHALDRLEAGRLGQVRAIYAHLYGRPPTAARGPLDTSWFLDAAQAGWGGFGDLGSHAIDGVCRLADAHPTQVYARIGTTVHERLPIDDLGVAHLDFPNGVHAIVSAGWATPDAAARWLDLRFEVLTTTHAFTITGPHRTEIEVIDRQQHRLLPAGPGDQVRTVDDFVAVMDGRPPMVSGADARDNMAILVAAHRSANTGRPVPIPTTSPPP